MKNKTVVFLAALCLFFSANAFANTVILKSGEKLEGKIVEATDQYIKMDPGVGIVMTYYADDIDSIDGQKVAVPEPQAVQATPEPTSTDNQPTEAQAAQDQPTASGGYTLDQYLQLVAQYIKSQNYQPAFMVLNRLIDNGYANAQVYAYRAVCYEYAKNYEAAIKDYLQAMKLDPSQGKQYEKALGFNYMEKGHWPEARAILKDYVTYYIHDDAEAYYGLALSTYYLKDYAGALGFLNAAQGFDNGTVPGLTDKIAQAKILVQAQQRQDEIIYQRPRSTSSSSSSGKDIGYAFVFMILGVGSFFHGFKILREKRLIQNIPSSTVRSLAMGLVELSGKAKYPKTLTAPLTQTPCVFYRYIIQRLESSGKSSHWVTIAQQDSTETPFMLDDDTGHVLVLCKNAELVMPVDYSFQTSNGAIPDNLISFMDADGLQYRGLFGTYTLKFQEWHIKPEEPVFILGTAQKNTLLTPEEGVSGADVVVAKGESNEVFIVSDESQTQIVKDFGWKSFLGIWGGAALSLSMLAYLLWRFGLWQRFGIG